MYSVWVCGSRDDALAHIVPGDGLCERVHDDDLYKYFVVVCLFYVSAG